MERPAWLDGKESFSQQTAQGSCPIHVNGLQAQREEAIAKARNVLAANLGTEVEVETRIEVSGTEDGTTTRMEQKSKQKVRKKVVKAEVLRTWIHPRSGRLFVLIGEIE